MKFRLYSGLFFIMNLMTACLIPLNTTSISPTPSFDGDPIIQIASPLQNSVYRAGTPVNILARVENAGDNITRIEIKIDETLIGEVENPNPAGAAAFSVVNSWLAQNAGEQVLSITVTRSTDISVTETVNLEIRDAVSVADAEMTGDMGVMDETLPTNTSLPATALPAASSTPQQAVEQVAAVATSLPALPSLPSPAPLSTIDTRPEQPAEEAASAIPPTSEVLKVRVINEQGANVRLGPGTTFEVLGGFSFNDETDLLAQNVQGTWYKIRYYNRSDAWIAGSVVELLGDTTGLPTESGPTAVPATATPAATFTPIATNTPDSQVNLIVDNVGTNPHPLVCGQSSTVTITVRNAGTANATNGGLILVEAIRVVDRSVIATTETVFGNLGAGNSQTAEAFITVSSFVGEEQLIRVTVDSNNQISESNEGDNSREEGSNYFLQSGGC
ncbi:MAG: CARDB domain-containing protein [Aggregatilineales bacterium]